MDLSKCKKPIHFTCPKCRADFEFDGGELIATKNKLNEDIKVMKARMQTHRNEYGRDNYYFKLTKRLKELEAQYSTVKHQIQLASEQSELQLFILFKKKLFNIYGQDEIVEILKECEDEMQYHIYDMAIQNHTNFDGA